MIKNICTWFTSNSNLLLAITSIGLFFIAWVQMIKTSNQRKKEIIFNTATDYLGELENLRLREVSANEPNYGRLISLLLRLKILLIKKNEVFEVAEKLRIKADKHCFDKDLEEKFVSQIQKLIK